MMVSQRLRHRIFPLAAGVPVIAFLAVLMCSAQIGEERLDLGARQQSSAELVEAGHGCQFGVQFVPQGQQFRLRATACIFDKCLLRPSWLVSLLAKSGLDPLPFPDVGQKPLRLARPSVGTQRFLRGLTVQIPEDLAAINHNRIGADNIDDGLR